MPHKNEMTGSDERNQSLHERKRRRQLMLKRIIIEWYGKANVTNADLLTEIEFRGGPDYKISEQTLYSDLQGIGALRAKRTINGRTGNYMILLGWVPPHSPESMRDYAPPEQLESELYRMMVMFTDQVLVIEKRVMLLNSIYMGRRMRFHVNSLSWDEHIEYVEADDHVTTIHCRTTEGAELVYERLVSGVHYEEP